MISHLLFNPFIVIRLINDPFKGFAIKAQHWLGKKQQREINLPESLSCLIIFFYLDFFLYPYFTIVSGNIFIMILNYFSISVYCKKSKSNNSDCCMLNIFLLKLSDCFRITKPHKVFFRICACYLLSSVIEQVDWNVLGQIFLKISCS